MFSCEVYKRRGGEGGGGQHGNLQFSDLQQSPDILGW